MKNREFREVFPVVELNNELTFEELKEKILEESLEVVQAFQNKDLNNLSEELLDLAQVAINAHRQLMKRENMSSDIELQKHIYKLESRGLVEMKRTSLNF